MIFRRTPIRSVPRTGQTTSYRTGDDGTFRAGWPMTRFVDNADGTVSDYCCDPPLIWVKQPELIIPGATGVHSTNQIQVARGNWDMNNAYAKADLVYDSASGGSYWVCVVDHNSGEEYDIFGDFRAAYPTYWRQTVWTASAANLTTPAMMTWNNAIDNSLNLVYAGYDDWRLPSVYELLTIFNPRAASAPMSYPTFFPNTKSHIYWGCTTYGPAANYAWYVGFEVSVGFLTADAKTAARYLRPVRGGIVNA